LKQKGEEFGGRLRDAFNNLKGNVIVQGLTPEQNNPSNIASQTKDTPDTANTSFTSEAKKNLTDASVGNKDAKQAIIAKKKIEVSNNIANAGDVPLTLDISADLDRQWAEVDNILGSMEQHFDSDRFFGVPTDTRSVVAKAGDALHVTEGNYFQGSVGAAIDGFRNSDSLVEKTIFGVLGAFATVPAVAEIVTNGIYNTPSRIAHGLDSMSYNAQNLMNASTFDDGVIAGLGLVRDTSFEILDLASLGGLGAARAARAGIAGSLVGSVESGVAASGGLSVTRARIEANIAESVAAREASRFDVHKGFEIALTGDVSTSRNGALFFSGKNSAGISNYSLANDFASRYGKTTINMTPAGQQLNALDLFPRLVFKDGVVNPSYAAETSRVWETVSKRYAQGSSGNVNAFVDGARLDSIYMKIERPTLNTMSDVSVTRK
jgi:hypothetical protein